MLVRNAHWILLVILFFLVYIIYTASDESPNNSPNASFDAFPREKPGVSSSQNHLRSPLIVGAGANRTRLKSILYWNEFYGSYDTFNFGFGNEPFVENGCEWTNCFATKDRTALPVDEFDAIIIHIRGLPNDWPKIRSPSQRYIMLSIDPPVKLYEYRRLERLNFNWTMTYRMDSTFPVPYSTVERVLPLPAEPGTSQLDRYIDNYGREAAGSARRNIADGKIGLIAQFSTKCHTYSRSEAYVRELRRFIPVDIYGKCGDFSCPKPSDQGSGDVVGGDNWLECHKRAAVKYKFFLAFEDAVCKDYVTEKLFSMFNGGIDMIPIVLGGANYSSIAPYRSYIDASKFPSPKELAHFLKIVDSDDSRYNSYFWWRTFYKRKFAHHQQLCDLCGRLNTDKTPSTYPDMRQWWVDKAECSSKPRYISQEDMI